MGHKGLNSSRRASGRRERRGGSAGAAQYSLFGAAPAAPDGDAGHYERQAQLCQRLLSSLHQPELVALLGLLQAEYEAKASPMPVSTSPDQPAS